MDPPGSRAGRNFKPLDASDLKLLDPSGVTVRFLESSSHHKNWLDCVLSRQTPLSPATVAHHANTACIVSWIAMKLRRPPTSDPKVERFANDAEANALPPRPDVRRMALARSSKAGRREGRRAALRRRRFLAAPLIGVDRASR